MVDVRTIKAGDTSDTCFKVLNQCTARGLGRSTIMNLETTHNFEVMFDNYNA